MPRMNDEKKYSMSVTAQAFYLPDQSDEDNDQYVFAYTIRITNSLLDSDNIRVNT